MPSSYRIRWKGRIEGPFTRDEIARRLARGELSMLHRVELRGEWKPLSALMDTATGTAQPAAARPAPAKARPLRAPLPSGDPTLVSFATFHASDARVRLAYALCGLTFLLPLIATLPALVVSAGLRRRGRKTDGEIQYALIAVFTALGLVFWHLVRQAFLAGRLG